MSWWAGVRHDGFCPCLQILAMCRRRPSDRLLSVTETHSSLIAPFLVASEVARHE